MMSFSYNYANLEEGAREILFGMRNEGKVAVFKVLLEQMFEVLFYEDGGLFNTFDTKGCTFTEEEKKDIMNRAINRCLDEYLEGKSVNDVFAQIAEWMGLSRIAHQEAGLTERSK